MTLATRAFDDAAMIEPCGLANCEDQAPERAFKTCLTSAWSPTSAAPGSTSPVLLLGDVELVPAGRLRSLLTACGQRLSAADVAALVAQARAVLHPAG